MGKVIHFQSMSSLEHAGFLKPIIYCCPDSSVENGAISFNSALSEKLSSLNPQHRTMRLAMCFEDIIKTLPDNVVIKDFDVMFNPEYKVDVLKIMVNVCKRKPFGIVWPGKYEDGKLFYAENGYKDFKIFNIEDYDITCIV